MKEKRKLLIVGGAGASIEFGFPSTFDIHENLKSAAQSNFPLVRDQKQNLYCYIYDEISKYWSGLGRRPDFEDALFAIYELAATYPAGQFTGVIGAFVERHPFPEIIRAGQRKLVDSNVLRHLGAHLVDAILSDFRRRCKTPRVNAAKLQDLMDALASEFEISIVTTNYDDLLYRAAPGLETGFQPDVSDFYAERIFARKSWPCILHLHGSVHFDMRYSDGQLHRIFWQDDLNRNFEQNSWGRNPLNTTEGFAFPTSAIIAGRGKFAPIQAIPFRIYYSELDRLVFQSDCLLVLGNSLTDAHVRIALAGYRDSRRRHVVFVDWASENDMTTCGSIIDESTVRARAARIFGLRPQEISWLGYTHPNTLKRLKDANELERSTAPERHLALWHNGMLEACNHANKILAELV